MIHTSLEVERALSQTTEPRTSPSLASSLTYNALKDVPRPLFLNPLIPKNSVTLLRFEPTTTHISSCQWPTIVQRGSVSLRLVNPPVHQDFLCPPSAQYSKKTTPTNNRVSFIDLIVAHLFHAMGVVVSSILVEISGVTGRRWTVQSIARAMYELFTIHDHYVTSANPSLGDCVVILKTSKRRFDSGYGCCHPISAN